MTGVSRGRAAYEAYCAAMEYVECQPWDDLVPEFQSAMEAAAEAASGASRPAHDASLLAAMTDAISQLAAGRGELRSVLSHFAETWRELMTGMPDSYACTYTCGEAEAAADLYRALGDEDTAAAVIAAHAAYDQDGDEHYQGAAPPVAAALTGEVPPP